MINVVICSIILTLIAFSLFSIRVIFKKNEEFRGTCANNNPFFNKEGVSCGVCGRKPDEPCGAPDTHRQESN